jgi:hypothetical protein
VFILIILRNGLPKLKDGIEKEQIDLENCQLMIPQCTALDMEEKTMILAFQINWILLFMMLNP